jgi:hypothetical protein
MTGRPMAIAVWRTWPYPSPIRLSCQTQPLERTLSATNDIGARYVLARGSAPPAVDHATSGACENHSHGQLVRSRRSISDVTERGAGEGT